MDTLDIVGSTAEAAFATDESGRIVLWNNAAQSLLGYDAARVLGKSCHDIVCGRDTFGNRFCDEHCALRSMVQRHEPVRRFQMDISTASGQRLRVAVSVVVVPGPRPSQFNIVHLLQSIEMAEEAGELLSRMLADRAAALRPADLSPTPSPPALTARETEVLRLLADGTGNQEIADSMFISVTTVRNHVQNIFRKLDVHSKLEAVSLALRHRLI